MLCEMEWLDTESRQFKIRNQVHVFDSETIQPLEWGYNEFFPPYFYIKSETLSKGQALVLSVTAFVLLTVK